MKRTNRKADFSFNHDFVDTESHILLRSEE